MKPCYFAPFGVIPQGCNPRVYCKSHQSGSFTKTPEEDEEDLALLEEPCKEGPPAAYQKDLPHKVRCFGSQTSSFFFSDDGL